MRLRPHHLLCTQGYSGKGYSEEFVLNMTAITNRLRTEEDVLIDLVFSTDDICAACPNMLGTDLCVDQQKVKRHDQKLVEYFGLCEQQYRFQALLRQINAAMTKEMLADVCEGCSWSPVSACRRNILGLK